MRYYLDTEFNGFGGNLISLALYGDEHRGSFYVEMPRDHWGPDLDPWVEENVVPHLWGGGHVKHREAASLELADFVHLAPPGFEIIADWPADFMFLCAMLDIDGKLSGFRMRYNELKMRCVNTPDLSPWRIGQQHNALDDARTLENWHQAQVKAK